VAASSSTFGMKVGAVISEGISRASGNILPSTLSMIADFDIGFIPTSRAMPPSMAITVEATGMGIEAIRSADFSNVTVRFS